MDQLKHKPTILNFCTGVYSDVNKRVLLEQELTAAKDKMQDIINAIPGGVAIYKVSDIFETIYFSDGVPELSGYTVEEYPRTHQRRRCQNDLLMKTPKGGIKYTGSYKESHRYRIRLSKTAP